MNIWIGLALIGLLLVYRKQLVEDFRFLKRDPKSWGLHKWKEWGEPLLVAAILAFMIRTFLIGPYKIPTGSMRPTLMEGDRIFVDKISYRFRPPKRGEVIVFKYPLDIKKDFVKRLIAFSGEEVEIKDGGILLNDKPLIEPFSIRSQYYYNRNDWQYGRETQRFRVPEDSFFVLGDNSAHSSDSRNWGFVPKKDLVGRAVLIWWPLKRVGLVKSS